MDGTWLPVFGGDAMSLSAIQNAPVCKHGTALVVGRAVAPDLAAEIIRVTDVFFWNWPSHHEFRFALARRLGFPSLVDVEESPDESHDDVTARWFPAAAAYRQRWGALDVEVLSSAIVGGWHGWCHADGTVARVWELDGWVYPHEIWADCVTLAQAFPSLEMTVAIWGSDHIFALNMMVHEALEKPWTPAIRDAVRPPSHGIIVRGGRVEGIMGNVSDLFGHLGFKSHAAAVERTFDAQRRLTQQPAGASTATPGRGPLELPEALLVRWETLARKLGLVA